MRRIVLAAALTAVLTLAAAVPAGADPPGGVDPACADITAATAIYMDVNGSPPNTFLSNAKTAAPTCKNVDYTVSIVYTSGGALVQTSQTQSGDGQSYNGLGLVRFSPIPGVFADNSLVCVRFTSSRGNGDNIYDWAPDSSQKTTPYVDGSGNLNCNGWGEASVDAAGAGGTFN
jgi:hypothetical protein